MKTIRNHIEVFISQFSSHYIMQVDERNNRLFIEVCDPNPVDSLAFLEDALRLLFCIPKVHLLILYQINFEISFLG